MRTPAAVEKATVRKYAKAHGYDRYLESSVKGEAAIDWANQRERTARLTEIVGDADRLLELSRQAQRELVEDSSDRQGTVAAAELLGQLLLQDVALTENGANLKESISQGRMTSVHDLGNRQCSQCCCIRPFTRL